MRQFYAAGVRRNKNLEGEVTLVNVVIPLTKTSRIEAVNQAERIAKREKILDIEVHLVRGTEPSGGILTKNMKRQREARRKK